MTGRSVPAELLHKLAQNCHVPGASLYLRWRGETTSLSAGVRQAPDGVPVTAQTPFAIGSITKVFTATCAMILVADGDLDLDAEVGEYEPALRGTIAAELRLRDLLSHTSGLPADSDSHTGSALRYLVEHCGRTELVAAPGTDFSYSNAGYVLVGHLVSAATGMSWWEAVEALLLGPLGIEPGYVVADAGHRVCAAIGHMVGGADRRPRPVGPTLSSSRAAAGALALSAEGLAALAGPLLPGADGSLLPAEYAELMCRPVPAAQPYGLATGWALGPAVFGEGDERWFGHDGTGDGTSAHLRFHPGEDAVIALTTNANTGMELWRALLPELRELGLPIAEPVPDGHGDSGGDEGADCLGAYRNGGTEYLIGPGARALTLAADGVPVATLALRPDLSFTMHDAVSGGPPHQGRFLRDPATGRVDRLQVTGRTARRTDAPDGR